MPSHTAASALIKLFHLGGHPWHWAIWQDLTGIKHGLFPDDDRHLPTGWTRNDADDIKSYFRQYEQKPTEDMKIKFAVNSKDSSVPGRRKWNDFICKAWPKWNVHAKIVEGLRKHGVHPVAVLEQQGSLDGWPSAETYVPIALDAIAMLLFGAEAFDDSDILPYQLRKSLTILVQRSWARIRLQVIKDKAKLPLIEAAALSQFKGSCQNQVYGTN
jgi:TATA-binding protein-associated factor